MQHFADKDSVTETDFVESNNMLLKIVNKFERAPEDDFVKSLTRSWKLLMEMTLILFQVTSKKQEVVNIF